MSYKEMYFYLFARVADALEYLQAGDVEKGIYTLEQAELETEEMAMRSDNISDEP